MESTFVCCAAVRVMSLSSACMRRSAKPARPGPPPGDGLCAGAADAAKARIAADPNAPNAIDSFMLFPPVGRSEEHTSELQSRSDLVCRLLLEKKKKTETSYTVERLYVPEPLLCHHYNHRRPTEQ